MSMALQFQIEDQEKGESIFFKFYFASVQSTGVDVMLVLSNSFKKVLFGMNN